MTVNLRNLRARNVTFGIATPPPVLEFLDTFTGAAGALSGHTANVGGGWVTYPNSVFSGGLSNYEIDGSGNLITTAYNAGGVAPSGGFGLTNQTIEVDFKFTDSSQPYIGFLTTINGGGYYLTSSINQGIDLFEMDLVSFDSPNVNLGAAFIESYAAYVNTTVTLKIELLAGLMKFYLNNTLKSTVYDTRYTSGDFWLAFFDSFSFSVSRVSITNTNQPDPTVYTTPFNVTDTNDAQQNTVDINIPVTAGQVIVAGTTQLPGTSYNGDTYIRLFNPSNVEVDSSDDYQGSGSLVVYTALVTGTYVLKVGAYGNTSADGVAGYSLS